MCMATDASRETNLYAFAASVLTNAKPCGADAPDIGTMLGLILIQRLWDSQSRVVNGNQRISKLEAFDYAESQRSARYIEAARPRSEICVSRLQTSRE
jgi:hypothetical protein